MLSGAGIYFDLHADMCVGWVGGCVCVYACMWGGVGGRVD